MPATATNLSTFERVRAIAADLAGVDPDGISARTHLCNDLNFDSLDCMQFITAIEEEFSVESNEADAAEVRTIGDAVAWLNHAARMHAQH